MNSPKSRITFCNFVNYVWLHLILMSSCFQKKKPLKVFLHFPTHRFLSNLHIYSEITSADFIENYIQISTLSLEKEQIKVSIDS